jgi:hypothetical protein
MASEMSDPAEGAFAVTPSDSTSFAGVGVRGLYIGVTGDVAVVTPGRTTAVTFKAVPVGVLPVRCTKVMSTNTTATDIVALT